MTCSLRPEERACVPTAPSAESNAPAHTPGPWETHFWHDITGYPMFYIHGMSGEQKRDVPVLVANARLIAAAPDLLEVARQCAELAERWGEQGPLVRAARAAIAKATTPGEAGAVGTKDEVRSETQTEGAK